MLLLLPLIFLSTGLAQDFTMFDGSADMVLNPERGFRWEFDSFPLLTGIEDAIANNVTLVQCYVYLPPQPIPLNSSFLSALDDGFAALRSAGMKAVLRFAYDRLQPGENNYTFETISLHQENLAVVVANAADVIFVLEAGFIGSWGEWHSSLNKLEENETALSALVANELYGSLGLPSTTFVMLRYRALKDKVLRPSPPLSSAQKLLWPNMVFGVVDSSSANTQTASARIGYHNDGFLSTSSDGDTYYADLPSSTCGTDAVSIIPLFCTLDGPQIDTGFITTTLESPYLPIGGEMYWNAGGNGTNTISVDGHTAAHRLRMQHFTYLSIVHGFAPYGRDNKGQKHEGIILSNNSYSQIQSIKSSHSSIGFDKRNAIAPSVTENINAWMSTPLNISRLLNCGGPTWSQCGMPLPSAYEASSVNRTVFDYIRDFLGYRLQLNSAYWPGTIILGSELSVAAKITNFGFSSPINPRLIYIVLIDPMAANGSGEIVFISHFPGIDVRSFMPYIPGDPEFEPIENIISASPELLPNSLSIGNYYLGLYLPDAYPGASNSSAFSIRLANRACISPIEIGNGCVWFWKDARGAGGVNVIGKVNVTS